MNMEIQMLNRSFSFFNSSYYSPIADTFSGNGILQNYIKARLTNQQTVRILLDQDQFEAQKNAIASEIADRTVKVLRSVFH